MALVRALIRRRLGREPCHCHAFRRFEVDFLATRLVYSRAFREFHNGLQDQIPLLDQQRPTDFLHWRVETAKASDNCPYLSNTLQDLKSSHAARDGDQILLDRSELLSKEPGSLKQTQNSAAVGGLSVMSSIEEASSQHLLRVRERLGDLCQWPSEALESAQSLVYSVESFMDEFFPKRLDSFDWAIETIGLSTERSRGRQDYITVPIQKSGYDSKWQVSIGAVDAILSLWIASIEAQADAQRSTDKVDAKKTPGQTPQLPNWRRTKAGVDLHYNYCRILGDDFEDGSLKRDLSWWVDELIAEQSASQSPTGKVGPNHGGKKSKDQTYRWDCSNARANAKATDLIIGFNGRSKNSDARRQSSHTGAKELAISSSGLLPNILAQHLFTSFIWTVVEKLPENCFRQGNLSSEEDVEIENRHAFDPHEFVDTWLRPTLRHRELTKLVRRLENFGLGSRTDVLLCIIPALSFKDLLPNHVMLKLMPQIRRGQGWAETAHCYNRLLEQGLRVTPHGTMAEEKFCYNVVVATIDFLCFASEPYDEHVWAPYELSAELEDIVARLTSIRFAPVVKKLAQAYILQRRNEDIAAIFKLFGTTESLMRLAENKQLRSLFGVGGDLQGCLEALKVADKLDFAFLEKSLGFSKFYRTLYEALSHTRKKDTVQPSVSQLQVKAAKGRDIFDWTPLHYAAFLEDKEILYRYFDPTQVYGHLSLQKELGPLGRSPIHMATISGSPTALHWISKCLKIRENKKNAYDATGIDGMSPLHLATKNGHDRLVDKIMRKKRLRNTNGLDIWGRAAIHLAASHGHENITKLLLNEDSQIEAIDDIGNTALDYLVKISGELRDPPDEEKVEYKGENGSVERANSEKEADHAKSDSSNPIRAEAQATAAERKALVRQKLEIFVEFAKKSLKSPMNRDKSGRTYLHHAIEYTNTETIERLLSIGYKLETKDSVGHTALLFAFSVERHKIALKLLEGFTSLDGLSSLTSVKDEQGCTPLMLAAMHGYVDIVRRLAEQQPSNLHGEDMRRIDGKVAIKEKSLANPTTEEALQEDYGPLARNLNGETALFLALQHGQVEVADYLLHKSGQVQENPNDKAGNSLLVVALGSDSVSVLVPSIHKEWTGIVNQPDPWLGQTPLSLACENGLEDTVNLLLGIEEVDVNKPASGWGDRTPLHLAVQEAHFTIVQKLLSHSKILVDLRDSNGESAMDKAAQVGDAPILKALLEHHQTSSERRLEFVSSICTSGTYNLQGIVPNILEYIEDATITDEELIQLIDLSEDMRSSVPYKAFVERAFSRDTWKVMDHPYHPVVRIGRSDLVKRLKDYGRETTDLDEDGWSCIEYAKTYCLENVQDDILDLVQLPPTKSGRPKKPEFNTPNTLHYPELADSVEESFCKDHKECPSLHYVTVTKQEDKFTHASIRSEHCTPPLSESTKHFYFEVTVLNEPVSKILGLGFCNKRYPTGGMPGWYRSSWGYHGDDGAIFLNNANSDFSYYKKESPSDDFGAKGEFGANDIVGVGLNLETGKGFVTLNGNLRDVGDMFEGEKFNDRKMYPCVGIDTTDEGVGLRFVINFGESADHPFKFKGPYP
ncbi:hypothetical protein HBH92_210860 [Parastagonospora nodorum]|nr:hypothetical protein HBH51_213590 [Parastagonospora nodorum]KAH3961425.1 hypothetical protein HBH52_231150 [Parastagonospora nodorum]KAH4016837.1 hypothetical protein HBI09_200800 [Parastagonospora nodorum]KAH4402333.1 hypothetical protein HBH92_210860 [Parastagonospora nodorum]KAH4413774.1 hypothetical protein HBH93_217050 [Parastagonospora nodorum]